MISRTTKWVAGAHGALLLGLLTSSLLKGCSLRKKKPQPLTIEISMVSAATATPQAQAVQQMPKESIPEPTPSPVSEPTPVPKPTPVPEPKPKAQTKKTKTPKKKWVPKKVIRQNTKVRNPSHTPSVPKISTSSLSLNEVATPSASSSTLPASYGQIIRSKMYAAWRQPSISTNQSRGAIVQFRIEKNGIVTDARIIYSSGNAQIDNTALQAAKSVRLPELPSTISEGYVEVSVEFMLTD